jgi:hypothetical protein
LLDRPLRHPPDRDAFDCILRFGMLPQIAKNMTRKLWKLLVYTLTSVEC